MKTKYEKPFLQILEEKGNLSSTSKRKTDILIPLSELKERCDCQEKYTDFRSFKKYVLLPTLKCIAEHTPYSITYTPMTGNGGQKYTKIWFHVLKHDITQPQNTNS